MSEPPKEEFVDANWLAEARIAMDPVEPCDPVEHVMFHVVYARYI